MTRDEWLASLQTFDRVRIRHVTQDEGVGREASIIIMGDGAVRIEGSEHDFRDGSCGGFDIFPAPPIRRGTDPNTKTYRDAFADGEWICDVPGEGTFRLPLRPEDETVH